MGKSSTLRWREALWVMQHGSGGSSGSSNSWAGDSEGSGSPAMVQPATHTHAPLGQAVVLPAAQQRHQHHHHAQRPRPHRCWQRHAMGQCLACNCGCRSRRCWRWLPLGDDMQQCCWAALQGLSQLRCWCCSLGSAMLALAVLLRWRGRSSVAQRRGSRHSMATGAACRSWRPCQCGRARCTRSGS